MRQTDRRVNQAARKTILVVEDDAATQQLLVALLRREKHDAAVAADGREAIQMLTDRVYDAVILDMMMPSVGGREVIDFITENRRPEPIIVCTAAGPRTVGEIISSSVKAVVRKPFDIDELVRAVSSVT